MKGWTVTRLEPWKLREVADVLDEYDRIAEPGRWDTRGKSMQEDLRRWADELEAVNAREVEIVVPKER